MPADEEPRPLVPSGERNILIYLSEKATLRAQREDGAFVILVGDDVEIRGVSPDHMAGLIGSVMDTWVPADLASRLMAAGMDRRAAWVTRREARRERRAAKKELGTNVDFDIADLEVAQHDDA